MYPLCKSVFFFSNWMPTTNQKYISQSLESEWEALDNMCNWTSCLLLKFIKYITTKLLASRVGISCQYFIKVQNKSSRDVKYGIIPSFLYSYTKKFQKEENFQKFWNLFLELSFVESIVTLKMFHIDLQKLL